MSEDPDSSQRLFSSLKMPTAAAQEPVLDLDAGELRGVIQEGVFRGVMKAVAVYLLISFLVWLVVSLVSEANRYS